MLKVTDINKMNKLFGTNIAEPANPVDPNKEDVEFNPKTGKVYSLAKGGKKAVSKPANVGN